ncbi:MAG: hypothetical protein Q8K36_05110 [Alphaproteobacteria bacterium]|nr:hypothetical protein [Alphaproteobacteria bacterium]
MKISLKIICTMIMLWGGASSSVQASDKCTLPNGIVTGCCLAAMGLQVASSYFSYAAKEEVSDAINDHRIALNATAYNVSSPFNVSSCSADLVKYGIHAERSLLAATIGNSLSAGSSLLGLYLVWRSGVTASYCLATSVAIFSISLSIIPMMIAVGIEDKTCGVRGQLTRAAILTCLSILPTLFGMCFAPFGTGKTVETRRSYV